MKSNKAKALMIGWSLCAMLLCVSLLLPLTMGRYGSTIDGYVEFDIGSFNASISLTEELSDDGNGNVISKFVEYSIYDFKPGMYSKELDPTQPTNTAATTKFRIANGNSNADAASTPLEYTIRIRTSNSLPLRYTLKSTVAATEDSPETYEYYQPLTEPTTIIETLSEPRYEYQFHTTAEETPDGDTPAEDAQAEEDPPAADPTEYTEITFRLEQGVGEDALVYRDHELIAEWSADLESARSKYMKEVELVEILVTVISLNKTDDENYKFPSQTVEGEHANGILLLTPDAGSNQKDYSYTIDLRSFREDLITGTSYKGAFGLTLHNGFGRGLETTAYAAQYTMTLRVPAELENMVDPNDNWSFGVYRNDDSSFVSNLMTGATKTYILQDMKLNTDVEGSYSTYEAAQAALAAIPEDQDHYRIVAVYELNLADHNLLYYQTKTTTGTYNLTSDRHGYTIRATQYLKDVTDDAATDGTVKDEIAFLNKLEISIHAELVALPATPAPEPETEPANPPAPAE